jgi:hypothetical protein
LSIFQHFVCIKSIFVAPSLPLFYTRSALVASIFHHIRQMSSKRLYSSRQIPLLSSFHGDEIDFSGDVALFLCLHTEPTVIKKHNNMIKSPVWAMLMHRSVTQVQQVVIRCRFSTFCDRGPDVAQCVADLLPLVIGYLVPLSPPV